MPWSKSTLACIPNTDYNRGFHKLVPREEKAENLTFTYYGPYRGHFLTNNYFVKSRDYDSNGFGRVINQQQPFLHLANSYHVKNGKEKRIYVQLHEKKDTDL